jgi:hypothetical protein
VKTGRLDLAAPGKDLEDSPNRPLRIRPGTGQSQGQRRTRTQVRMIANRVDRPVDPGFKDRGGRILFQKPVGHRDALLEVFPRRYNDMG